MQKFHIFELLHADPINKSGWSLANLELSGDRNGLVAAAKKIAKLPSKTKECAAVQVSNMSTHHWRKRTTAVPRKTSRNKTRREADTTPDQLGDNLGDKLQDTKKNNRGQAKTNERKRKTHKISKEKMGDKAGTKQGKYKTGKATGNTTPASRHSFSGGVASWETGPKKPSSGCRQSHKNMFVWARSFLY